MRLVSLPREKKPRDSEKPKQHPAALYRTMNVSELIISSYSLSAKIFSASNHLYC